ncbi:MAG: P-type DNA transfer ATPase VirB11 [Pseudomonadota bacterium]
MREAQRPAIAPPQLRPVEPGADENVYLRTYLGPFATWLDEPDITEILVNRPGEVWIERAGAARMERHDVAAVDERLLERLAQQIARISHQGVSRASPLLAAVLPNGARVQMLLPSVTRGGIALAMRKHVVNDLSLDDYADMGAFQQTNVAPEPTPNTSAALRAARDRGELHRFLRDAVARRRTILISGGTSSGKTTLLNALLKEVPDHERVILIEDTPEIKSARDNLLGLTAASGSEGAARVGVDDLMRASLRMRPDRLILGELRGAETVAFLRAINTGHPGSLSTIHASTPEGAFEQLALMCLQANFGLSRRDTLLYAQSMIDIVVQLGRADGRRAVEAVIESREIVID